MTTQTLKQKFSQADSDRFEITRCLATMAVLLLHLCGDVVSNPETYGTFDWWFVHSLDSFVRFCVPVFVMLSGALLLRHKDAYDLPKFYKSRVIRIIPAIVFWTVVFLALRFTTPPGMTIKEMLRSIIEGTPYAHLWYLYMIIGMYAASPFLSRMIAGLSPRDFWLLTFGLLTIAAFEQLFGGGNRTFINKFFMYLGYYFAGLGIVEATTLKTKRNLAFTAYLIGSIALTVIVGIWSKKVGSYAWYVLYAYLHPLVIFNSLAVFVVLMSLNPSQGLVNVAKRLNKYSLGIYCIHPLLIYLIERYLFDRHTGGIVVGMTLMTIVIYLASLGLVYVFSKIPGLQKVV